MPRNDPEDLQPPFGYKMRHVARPLTRGEIKAAADRAEARTKQMSQSIEDQSGFHSKRITAIIRE
jgi:hypothetical protein